MPKNTQSSATSQTTYIVNPETFDIKRLGFGPLPSTPEQTQLISIPRYLYDESKEPTKENIDQYGKQLIIITDAIKLSKGGPPSYNEKYHGPNPDSVRTAYFYIPDIETDSGSKKLFSVINQIDEYMNNEINNKKNKNILLETFKSADKKVRVPVNGLRYTELAKLLEPSIGGKEFEPYRRLKVKFSSGAKYDRNKNTSSEEAQNETFLVDTQIYVGDEPEPKNCKTLTDIRQYFKWGCTAKFALVFNKLWMLKSGEKKCGISVKCVQLCITEQIPDRSQGITMQFKSNLFAKQQPIKNEVIVEKKSNSKNNEDNDTEDEVVEEEEAEEVEKANNDDDEEENDDNNDNDDNDDNDDNESNEDTDEEEQPVKKPEPKKSEPTKQYSKKPEPVKQDSKKQDSKKQEPIKNVSKQKGKQ